MFFRQPAYSALLTSTVILAVAFFPLAAKAGPQDLSMISIPAGSLEPFWIVQAEKGKESGKAELVPIAAFQAQPHAVTNNAYLKFLRSHPEWQKSRVSPLFAEQTYLSQFGSDLSLRKGVNENAPVTYVSWFAALAYCESQSLRLPTINEWEYMAAASETSFDANRDPAFLARILEWYSKPNGGQIGRVKSTYRNHYGLYDLHGLIWEWTEDFNSSLVTGESREDSALNRNLFCGAGSLLGGNKEDYAAFMRFAFRSSMKGKGTIWNLGFRCVR